MYVRSSLPKEHEEKSDFTHGVGLALSWIGGAGEDVSQFASDLASVSQSR